MARVDRRRRHHPRGRRRPHRPGRRCASGSTKYADRPLKIGSFSRGLQRHRHRLRHLRHLDAAARARRPVVLGLRRRRAVRRHRDDRARRPTRWPTRTRSSSRRTSSSAARRRPGCWWRGASCSPTGCPTCPAAARSPTSTPTTTPTSTDPAHREEGGTPAIIEAVRAGLVFQLKEAVGVETIRAARGAAASQRAVAAWREEPAIEILGNLDAARLSIVSFVVRAPSGRYLHHNFVVALLNDLFGDPVPRRLLVRRPLRPPAARHRPRALPRVRARDHRRLRGHQARLGAGELQLLPLRHRRRLRRRGGAPGRARRLAAARRLPSSTPLTGRWRHRDGLVEPPIRLRRRSPTTGDGSMAVPTRLDRAARTCSPQHLRDGRGDPRRGHAARPVGAPGRRVSADFEHLRWFDLPASAIAH